MATSLAPSRLASAVQRGVDGVRRELNHIAAPHLSPDQSDLAKLVAQGFTNRQIADYYGLSYGTIYHSVSLLHARYQTEDRMVLQQKINELGWVNWTPHNLPAGFSVDPFEVVADAKTSPIHRRANSGFVLVHCTNIGGFRAARVDGALHRGERMIARYSFIPQRGGKAGAPSRWEVLPPPVGVSRTAEEKKILAELVAIERKAQSHAL